MNIRAHAKILTMTILLFSSHVFSDPLTMPETTLWLEIVINGKPTGEVLPVDYRGGHYWLTSEQLQKVGLSFLNQQGNETVALDGNDQINVVYNGSLQQLLIDVPSSWLPEQRIAEGSTRNVVKAQSSTGFLMNYDIYATSPESKHTPNTTSLWSEQRLFSNYGIVSNTGIYSKSFNGKVVDKLDGRYIRYDTQWRYNDEQSLTRYAMGDVITDSLPWSNSVRLGGVQLARNFSIRPDLITYPLPQFAGQAAIPSTVDLYINSYKVGSSDVDPGPFTLDTQPFVTGAGNATVITTDALGRKVSTTVPFYVADTLLSKGLTDYSLSVGAIRRDYGVKSFEYSDIAATGVLRYGVTDWLTVESRFDTAPSLFSGGLGAGLQLGNFGVLNTAWSGSQVDSKAWHGDNDRQISYDPITGIMIEDNRQFDSIPSKNQGQQLAVGYTYNNARFSINAQRIIRTEGYADLSTYKSNYRLSRRQDQVTGSMGLDKFGNLGIGYFAIRDARGGNIRLMNLSWSIGLWGNSSLYTTINREIGRKGYSAQLNFTMPFGDWGTSSVSASRDKDNHWVERVSLSRATPIEGGVGWNLSVAEGSRKDDKFQQADFTWRSTYLESRAGVYGRSGDYVRWGELSGALIAMDGGAYATNTVTDAFALVSTNGFADIPVSYENRYIGNTNSKGYLLVPYVTSWYPSKLDISPLNLPADVEAPDVEKYVSIRESSGLTVAFPLKRVTSVSFILVDSSGKAMPKGSLIKVGDSTTSWVGLDGQVWLQDINTVTLLIVTRADNSQKCQLTLDLGKDATGTLYLEQQICQ